MAADGLLQLCVVSWITNSVLPDVSNIERNLEIHIIMRSPHI